MDDPKDKRDTFWSHFEERPRLSGSGSASMSTQTLTEVKEERDQDYQTEGYGMFPAHGS